MSLERLEHGHRSGDDGNALPIDNDVPSALDDDENLDLVMLVGVAAPSGATRPQPAPGPNEGRELMSIPNAADNSVGANSLILTLRSFVLMR